jgi:hypothetical protein
MKNNVETKQNERTYLAQKIKEKINTQNQEN